MNADIKFLKKWLEVNPKLAIAVKFGYRNTNTIDRWIERGNLPHNRRDEIISFLKKKRKQAH